MTEADLLVEFATRTDRIWDITQWWASVTFGVLLAAHVGANSLNKPLVVIILSLFTLFTAWVAQIVWANVVGVGAVKLALNDISRDLGPVGRLVLEDSGADRGITMALAVTLTYIATIFYILYRFRKA